MHALLAFAFAGAQVAPTTPAVPPAVAAPADVAPAVVAPVHTRLVILDLSANDVDGALVRTVSEGVAVTLQSAKIVDDVVSAADLRAMMNVEADKQTLGADCDVKESCMAEIAQALGADVLVHGSVGRYGALYAVSLSLFDAKANRAIAREKTESGKLEVLSKKVEYAAKRLALAYEGKSLELAGTEPTEPSGLAAPLFWTGLAVGALGTAGAVVGGTLAATASSTLGDPLSSGGEKASAQSSHPTFLAAAVTGGVVAAAGAGLLAASLFME